MKTAADGSLVDLHQERDDRAGRNRIGQIVGGNYRLVRQIGSGGSSHVFEAEHVRLGAAFAVKLLRPTSDGDARALQRFRREARALAGLRSEHIVRVVDCGELDDGTPYLAMELLHGEDLRRLLNREGALPSRRAVQLLVEACRGLAEVHRAGLVHRDLKPENLFVTRRSSGEDWCKVLDFGVAKMDASLSTAEGAIVGTVRYMAPEQLTDSASVSPATDVYALGAILYECLSGRPLHAGDAIQEVMFSVMNREAEPLGKLCPHLPLPLVEAVARAVAKSAKERPADASELEQLLVGSMPANAIATANTSTLPEGTLVAALPGGPRLQPPTRAVTVSLTWAILAGALGTGIGWLAKPAPADFVEPSRSSPVTSRTETAPVVPALAAPQQPETRGSSAPAAVPSSASVSSARSPTPIRPGPRAPQASPASSAPSPAKRVSVGQFDAANPYGD